MLNKVEVVEAMREWLLDCDMDEDILDELSDAQVLKIVENNY